MVHNLVAPSQVGCASGRSRDAGAFYCLRVARHGFIIELLVQFSQELLVQLFCVDKRKPALGGSRSFCLICIRLEVFKNPSINLS